jgi:type 1 glutamine amidotransferase
MKKALIVYGGWAGHEPKPVSEIFADELTKAGLQVELSETVEIFQQVDRLKEFSVIIPNWTMGALTNEQERGLAGVHGGMGDAFRNSTNYQFMVGGQFVAHPDNQRPYTIQIVSSTDPITAGIQGFAVQTEQYYMHVDPWNEVLATTIFQTESAPWINGCVMPVVWKRRHGQGRVFYSSLGHQASVFEIPEVRKITIRGMLWAAASSDAP